MDLIDWVDDVLPGSSMTGNIVCYIRVHVSLQWQRRAIMPTASMIE
jgi:hypothetical protein